MLVKISKSIQDGDFFENKALVAAMENCKKNDSALHLMGLREYILVTAGASGNTGSPLHVEDAVTIYNRLGKVIEAQMTGSDGSES